MKLVHVFLKESMSGMTCLLVVSVRLVSEVARMDLQLGRMTTTGKVSIFDICL